LRAAQNSTRPSSWRSFSRTLGDLGEHTRGAIVVDVEAAGDPPDRALGSPGALHQTEHQPGGDPHHDDPDDGDRSVDRVHAADRDRDDQTTPQQQVEHHRRTEPHRRQREAGIGAADPRQRHQSVAQRRSGGTPPGHDARQRAGAHLDAEHPHPGEVLARRAERGPGQKRVREQRPDLEHEAGDEQARFDAAQLGPRAAEPGDQRQHEEVEHGDERQQLERQPIGTPSGRTRGTLDLGQLTRHQTAVVLLITGVESGDVHAAVAGRPGVRPVHVTLGGHGRAPPRSRAACAFVTRRVRRAAPKLVNAHPTTPPTAGKRPLHVAER
jgi:hypothetical protein